MPRSRDPLHDLQLLRDLSIINARTAAELGPLPPGGVPIAPKRRPNLPRTKPSSEPAGTTPMTALPPPPVPQRLRDILKDYPEHIERLEEALNTVVTKPSAATPPFEVAIWALEGRLDTFRAEAHEELKAAEASGDPAAIEKARQKQLLMGRARSGGLYSLNEIEEHFKARRKEF